MLKLFNRKKKDNKGFTLVELVVVIAILAILVGLLAPQYTKYVEKARKSSDASNLENMVKAVEVAIADTDDNTRITAGKYTITINAEADKTSKAGTVVSTDKNADVTAAPSKDNAEKAISNVLGTDWNTTVLKSKNWTDNGKKVTSIYATIDVSADGSFSVGYSPSELVGMTGTKSVPKTTTP